MYISLLVVLLYSLVSFAIGLSVGIFYTLKRSKAVRRLKNINDVAESWHRGEYGNDEGQLVALSFILCESDLSIKKGKKNGKKKSKTRR